MPLFNKDELLACLKKLVQIDQSWYPNNENMNQLYIRLCHISTDKILGVKSPDNTKLFAMLTPNTLRMKNRRVKCAHNVNKNWPMGHGGFRISGNFGPLIPTVNDAK
jgi:branched-chain amino acid aminotransferase